MKVKENIGIRGIVTQIHRNKNGDILMKRDIKNQIQNAGLAEISSLILTDDPGSATAFDYMALGSGTGQAVTDTTLATEIAASGGERAAGTGTQTTTTVTNDTSQLVVTYSFTGALAITEAGIFNASSSGDMLCYQDFSVINVTSGDSLEVTWKIAFARP